MKSTSRKSEENKIIFPVILIFFLLSYYGIIHHELWLDEMQHWLLARDSHSLPELWKNTRYEGHPILWNFLLYLITIISDNPFWMQVFHICLSTFGAFVFLKYAPFPLSFRILFIFGYFALYEYNIISRNYGIGVIFLWCSCILFEKRTQNYPFLGCILAVAANTHLLCLIVASSMVLILFVDYFVFQDKIHPQIRKPAILGVFIFTIGLIIAFFQIITPPDHTFKIDTIHWFSLKRIGKPLWGVWKSFIPIPDFTSPNYWNSNLFIAVAKKPTYLFGLAILILPFIIFIKKPVSAILFYSGMVVLMIYFYLTSVVEAKRYLGYFYILFMMSIWISTYYKPSDWFQKYRVLSLLATISEKINKPFIYSLLIIQFIAGVIAYKLDIEKPFSQSRNATDYLIKNGLADQLIVASSYNTLPTMSGYLRKKIYSPDIEAFGSFCWWNTPIENFFTPNQAFFINKLENLTIKNPEFILVLNDPLAFSQKGENRDSIYENENIKIYPLVRLEGSVVKNESFYIYKVNATKP